jgi:hypothetical protein
MKKTLLLATLSLISSAYGYEAQIKKGALAPDLDLLIQKAAQDTGVAFTKDNFALVESRELATSNYKFYVQTVADVPVSQTALRMWTDKKTGELILAEMNLDETSQANKASLMAKFSKAKFSKNALASLKLKMAINKIVNAQVSMHPTDKKIIGTKSQDKWRNGDLIRITEVKSGRGVHRIVFSLLQNKIVEQSYMEYPQSEMMSLKANIFPMYEEVEGTGEKLPYEEKELKYITTSVVASENPLAGLSGLRYQDQSYDTIRAELSNNYWSEASMRRVVESYVSKLPLRPNNFESGLLLQGKFTTINIHPDARAKIAGINFDMKKSPHHVLGTTYYCDANLDFELTVAELMSCKDPSGALMCDANADAEVSSDEARGCKAAGMAGYFPYGAYYGKTISSQEEVMKRIPFRDPKHDPATYINAGFDELQVYYSVTTLMERLSTMGFTDPVLSTRPFHAFLYNPDISMKDNAFYTDDTINFTTYSPGNPNLARDNPTVWHELGHGVMERLMGAHLVFEETKSSYGGLSEGMADFVAKIVVEDQTNSEDFPGKYNFRIENNTGFYVTNELHDGGEAYGGVMKDMLIDAIKANGRAGLTGFADLTLETMRLTRNHPNLTPRGWFEHMVYADGLGSSVRAPGEYTAIINEALAARNFAFSSSFKPAEMNVKYGNMVLTSTSQASREKPIKACDASGTASYELKVALTSGDSNFITFPATVKVEYLKGALQGALKWAGEANNPEVYTVNSAEEVLSIPLAVNTKECDEVNQQDGSCKDYAYVQVYSKGGTKPIAKKRFYLSVKPGAACE